MEKSKRSLEQRKQERKDQRAERKASRVIHRATEVVHVKIASKAMTLKEAKLAAKEESRQHRKPLYVNVTEAGDFDLSLRYDSKSSLHCYRNGSEIAMEVPKKQSGPKQLKQTEESDETQQVMATPSKKSNKKADRPAKKSAGKIQKLSIKAICGLLKQGKTVRHERGFLPKLKNLVKKNQDLVWPVSVE